MSSWSDNQDCPMCGGKDSLMMSGGNKPYDNGSGECLECGFSFYTKEEQMSLDDVNESRVMCDMEPVTKLKLRLTSSIPM